MSVSRTSLAFSKTLLSFLLAPLGLFALGSAHAGTTFYVRTDGGDASQCTGRSDTGYSGSGTAQACAWKHPFFALAPNGTKRIAGGDTLLIGSGTYTIGQGAPGAGSCSGASCDFPPIPSGTSASAKTRFLGKSASAPPKFLGTNGVRVIDLQGSSNVEVGNLEITDQSDCVYNHSNSSASCASTGNWAKTGLAASDSSNVWLHDLYIHGMASQGVYAGRLTDWTVERVRIIASGRVGWGGNIGSDSSNSGSIVMRDMEIAWSGCGERWQTGAPWACWAQQTGGYGDGIGTSYTGGKWVIEDAFIHHNTSDGLDLRYMDGADGTHVTIRRLYAVGNAGNQAKVRGNSLTENSVIVSNCGYFKGKHYMLEDDNCRANGNTLQIVMTANDTAIVRHNTIAGEGGTQIGTGEGDSTGKVRIENNVFVGFPTYRDPATKSSVQYGNFPGAVSFAGNLAWNVKSSCPSGTVCNTQDPRLTNMTLDGFDAEPLGDSPVIDKVAVIAAVNTDFVSQPRPSGAKSDIGAYEMQTATSEPTPSPTPEPTPTCTRAEPAFSLAGPTLAVAAGSAVDYTLSLTNKDSSGCSNASFNLARTVPAGWTGTLSTTSMALAPGASGTAVLKVVSPTSATEGSYGIGVGTSSSVGSIHTSSASTTYAVLKPTAAASLTTTMTTSKSSYTPGEAMRIFALVKNNGEVLAGVNVTFVITQPDGQTTQVTSTSGSDGYARASHTASSVQGTHSLKGTWSYGGMTSSGVVSFDVTSTEIAPSLTTVITTDKSTYARNEDLRLFALVKNNGEVLEGVSVTFTITQPNGKTTQVTSTSGNDGYARASHKASKFRGTHTVEGAWSHSGIASTASTTFQVN